MTINGSKRCSGSTAFEFSPLLPDETHLQFQQVPEVHQEKKMEKQFEPSFILLQFSWLMVTTFYLTRTSSRTGTTLDFHRYIARGSSTRSGQYLTDVRQEVEQQLAQLRRVLGCFMYYPAKALSLKADQITETSHLRRLQQRGKWPRTARHIGDGNWSCVSDGKRKPRFL
jgi:hypothetical protein